MGMLTGKTAFVTGGSRGLGRKLVERLAAEGALVGFNYATSTDQAAETVRAVEANGGEAFAIQMKLGSNESIDNLVKAMNEELQRRKGDVGLNILINNMGGGAPVGIEDTTPEILDQFYSDNFRSQFLLTRALMPQLRDNGRVLNISSATVRIGFLEVAAYVCAKAALDKFSHLLAKALGPRGITVNSIGMGRTTGGSNDKYYANPEHVKQITDITALRRLGTEDDVAGACFALISPDGGWITGQVIDATGGFMI